MRTLLTAFLLLSAVPELAGVGRPAYFYYRNDNKPLLHYFRFQNTFDSSVTTYVFGEVALTNSGSTLRIPIDASLALDHKVEGVNSTGEDVTLRGYAGTQNFTLTGGGTISWFSQLNSFRSPCDPETVNPEPGEGPNIPTQAWGMLDRTEFVVELVSADSNTRMAVLDSVGAAPPQIGILADTRYGTNPQNVLKQYTIPAGFHGKQAYLRVSPRRYGPTPYGMTMCKIKNWVNFSARYDSTATSFIPEQDYLDLSTVFFAEMLAYCDSVKNATGWLPERFSEGIGLSRAEADTLQSRYCTEHFDSTSGRKFWREIPPWVWSKRGAPPKYEGNIVEVVSIQKIIPNPSDDRVTLLLTAKVERQVVVRLYSPDGRATQLWSGTLQEGENGMLLSPGMPASGVYTIVVEDRGGTRLASAPLVISR